MANSDERTLVPRDVLLVEIGELLLQVRHLRRIIVPDVRVVRVQRGVVLVIPLRRIERLNATTWVTMGRGNAFA